jgi:hypothetical protein
MTIICQLLAIAYAMHLVRKWIRSAAQEAAAKKDSK